MYTVRGICASIINPKLENSFKGEYDREGQPNSYVLGFLSKLGKGLRLLPQP